MCIDILTMSSLKLHVWKVFEVCGGVVLQRTTLNSHHGLFNYTSNGEFHWKGLACDYEFTGDIFHLSTWLFLSLGNRLFVYQYSCSISSWSCRFI